MDSQEKKKLLIVDDEEALRDILYQELTEEGFDVETLGEGSKVVEAVKSKKYDLLLLDISMPNISGFEVLEQLKKEKISIKSVMLSGYDDLKNAIQAARLGAVGFISKPFRFHDIIVEIEKALSR